MSILLELSVALAAATLALYCYDAISARFRANPDPRRALKVRALGILSILANVMFYATVTALVVAGVVWASSFVVAGAGGSSISRPFIAGAVVAGFSVAGFLRTRIRHFANSLESSSKAPGGPLNISSNAGSRRPYFIAMQYYALVLNRTYKVFEADTMLSGAVVNGLVASPLGASDEALEPEYWARTPAESLYFELDVSSPAFLKLNLANFQIPWRDIARFDFTSAKKWGMGNVPHSGRLFVRLKSGRSRELILLGSQDGEALLKRLSSHLAENVSVE